MYSSGMHTGSIFEMRLTKYDKLMIIDIQSDHDSNIVLLRTLRMLADLNS